MSQRMRTVHDGDDAPPPRHRGQLAEGEELSGWVREVAKMQHLRLRRDGGFESPQQVRLRRGAWKIQPRDFDLVPFFPLIPRGQYSRIILIGRDDLVARFQIDAHLGNLKRLARVASNGNFLRVCTELGGQPAPRGLDVSLDQRAVIRGRRIGSIHVWLDSLVY